MSSPLLNIANELLPSVVRGAVHIDDDLNLKDISTVVDKIAAAQAEGGSADLAGIKLLGKLVDARLKLKYRHAESVMSKCVALLYNTYLTKKLSVPSKSLVLGIMTKIIAKKDKSISTFQAVKFDWKAFWAEAVALVTRENKIGQLASEQLLSHLVDDLVKFLHCARKYTGADDAEAMVESAMAALSDARPAACLEGLILLVTCLPTDFAGYDKWLPAWVDLWCLQDNNSSWDACWLTLLTRARKYTATYPWQQLRPALSSKARQLLSLKTLSGAAPAENKFPVFYARLYATPYGPRKVALNKVSKLMYFCSFHQQDLGAAALVLASPIAITPSRPVGAAETAIPGFSADAAISGGTHELALFFQSLRTYFHPSNNGEWTELLGFFVCTMVSEVSRHAARSIAYCTFESSSRGSEPFQQPLHLPSLRFLQGTMLSLVLEGLYSRNQTMQRLCSASLKNACLLDPTIAAEVVPFVLSALDEDAVNQPHQATAALYAMTLCIKPLLYPQPALLPYLPALLRLSLPGLDPNNASKTCITLGMLSSVFSFVPARSSYAPAAAALPPYLARAHLVGGAAAADALLSAGVSQSVHYDALADTLVEWVPQFLDRCVALLEAQEAKKAGQKPAFMVGAVLAECVGLLFQAMPLGDPVRVAAEDRLLASLLSRSPLNAAKIAGRLVEAVVSTNPARLQEIVRAAVDAEVLAGSYSPEKIAFRLRLVSGAVSSAGGEALVPALPLLLPLLGSSALVHSDKVRRKASVKLLKDLLKGLSSFYPLYQPPVSKQSGLVGGPADVTRTASLWHEPSPSSLTAAAALLRCTALAAMAEVRDLLSGLRTDVATEAHGVKKVEETVFRKLTVICKALRGCADVLIDTARAGEASGDIASGDASFHSGREELVRALAPEDSALFESLRAEVMLFLASLSDALAGLGVSGGAHSALSTSELVRSAWVKLCKVAQAQRMARLKNVEEVRRYFRTSIRMQTTVLVKTMTKLVVGRNGGDDIFAETAAAGDWRAELRDLKHWLGHDVSSNMMSNRGLVHHASRLQRFSFSALRDCLRDARAEPYLRSMTALRALGAHDYEKIRNKSLKAYTALAPRFGAALLPDLKASIAALCAPGTGYCTAAGALTVVSSTEAMKKICASWELSVLFLTSVAGSAAMTAAIPETDRREGMSHAIAMLFSLYTERWHSSPLTSEDMSRGGDPAAVVATALRQAGSESAGLRQEAHAAFTLLHLLGNPAVPVPADAWAWAVSAVASRTGPAQNIALCALIKLCYMVQRGALPAPALGGVLFPAMYRQLLQGVSATRPSPANPLWSKGVDEVIMAAAHIKMVLPRAVTNIVGDRVISSDHFRKENSAMFACLPDVLSVSCAEEARRLVLNLLEASRALESTSEEEERANNTTRAEVFAGLHRAFVADSKAYLDASARAAIESMLVDFLAEAADRVSNDFNCDWAEAVYFAATAAPCASGSRLLSFVAAGAAKALSLTGSHDAATVDEGFLRHEKSLSLTRCLLVGDIAACAQRGVERSEVAGAVQAVLERHGCTTPYRSTRVEMAFIITALAEAERTPSGEQLSRVVQRLVAEAAHEHGDKSAQSTAGKNAAETAVYLLQVLVEKMPPWRRATGTSALLAAALPCCAHADADFAAKAKSVCLLLAHDISPGRRAAASAQSANFEEAQRQLLAAARSSAWHVQEAALTGLVVVMLRNWWLLTAAEKIALRDAFTAGLGDPKPEIAEVAKTAMVHYLSLKTTRELAAVAAAYGRNCDTLAARAAASRRSGAERDPAADKVYVNTMQMCCCLLLSFRYDLPPFLPALAASIARNMGAAPVQDLVTKTVQEFRASHQDRWQQFKGAFSAEQLDDLQGAGAAHWYC